MVLNSKDLTFELIEKKKNRTTSLLNQCTMGTECDVRYFAKLLGMLNACSPALAYSPELPKVRYQVVESSSSDQMDAYCNGLFAHGFRTEKEKSSYIDYLELLAVSIHVKSFASHLLDFEKLLRVDNTTSLVYINKQGGMQHSKLNNLVRDICQWCEERKIWIVASYVPSKQKVETYEVSRKINVNTEWELNDKVFVSIV